MHRRNFLFGCASTLMAPEEAPLPIQAGSQVAASFYSGEACDKPFLYPIKTVSGKVLSRGWPLEPREGDSKDHGWHRGFWYGHGSINGADFWREQGRDKTARLINKARPHVGKGSVAVELSMTPPDGTAIGSMRQEFRFADQGNLRTIDAVIMILADCGVDLLFGDSDERYHVRGGNDLVTSALAKKLDDAIETGTVLEALSQSADGRYVLSLRRGSASTQVRAAQVILALPFTTLRQVRLDVELPAAQRDAITRLRYGTNAKLMIGFERRVWREQRIGNGSLMCDLGLQTTWETSRQQAGTAGILTNFTGGRQGLDIGQGTPKFQADQAAASLDAVWPGVAASRGAAREARFHWPTHPWTQGSYACFGPGDWTRLRQHIATPSGNLHFAGEHCSPDNQGFMEGGLESGEVVAERILARHSAAVAPLRRRLAAAV